MKLLKGMALVLCAISSLAMAKTRDTNKMYHLSNSKITSQSGMSGVTVAFDEGNKEFVWQDFTDLEQKDWEKIPLDLLDETLRDITTIEAIKAIDEHEGTYWKVSKVTEKGADGKSTKQARLNLEFRIRGGGPTLAAMCGVVCKIIGAAGCTAGTILLLPNPVLSALYASVCTALDTGGTAGCIAGCLALPTP